MQHQNYPMIKFELAPNKWGDVWKRYVEHGISPGSFGVALLTNNLRDAFARADWINIEIIPAHLCWMMEHLPYQCWGSEEAVTKWVKHRGLSGAQDEVKDDR